MAEKQVRVTAPAGTAAPGTPGALPNRADDSWQAKLPGILKSVVMFMVMQMGKSNQNTEY